MPARLNRRSTRRPSKIFSKTSFAGFEQFDTRILLLSKDDEDWGDSRSTSLKTMTSFSRNSVFVNRKNNKQRIIPKKQNETQIKLKKSKLQRWNFRSARCGVVEFYKKKPSHVIDTLLHQGHWITWFLPYNWASLICCADLGYQKTALYRILSYLKQSINSSFEAKYFWKKSFFPYPVFYGDFRNRKFSGRPVNSRTVKTYPGTVPYP